MNYYYEPEVAAQVAAYVNYVCPVQGWGSQDRRRAAWPARSSSHRGLHQEKNIQSFRSPHPTRGPGLQRDVGEGRGWGNIDALKGRRATCGSSRSPSGSGTSPPSTTFPWSSPRVLLRPARPVRLRQDDDAADDRRSGAAHPQGRILIGDTDLTGSWPYERPVTRSSSPTPSSPPDDPRQCRVFGPKRRKVADARSRPTRHWPSCSWAPRRPQADPALRRSTAARRGRPGDRQQARGASARRAAGRPDLKLRQPDADRAQAIQSEVD